MKKLLLALILSYCCSAFAMIVMEKPPVTCNEKGHCEEKWPDCTKEKPLRQVDGPCVECDYSWGLLGGTVLVHSPEDCAVCPNRKLLKYNGSYRCALKTAPKNSPLVLKYGYRSCGYCVNEEDIVDCSKCLDNYTIIKGKCKRKPERPCFQA